MNESLKKQLISDVDELSNKVGEFIRYWGFKNIHGKIWCHLFLSEHPLDATDLIARTGVSKALMSQSLSELLEYNVIEIEDEGRKKKRYVTNQNILTVITSILRKREQNMLCDIHSHFRVVSNFSNEQLELAGIDAGKLKRLGNMVSFAEKFLCSMLRFESFSFKSFKKVFEPSGPK